MYFECYPISVITDITIHDNEYNHVSCKWLFLVVGYKFWDVTDMIWHIKLPERSIYGKCWFHLSIVPSCNIPSTFEWDRRIFMSDRPIADTVKPFVFVISGVHWSRFDLWIKWPIWPKKLFVITKFVLTSLIEFDCILFATKIIYSTLRYI
jgi:hypothetical protein